MTVYVVQMKTVLDRSTGMEVPQFPTINQAQRFGELSFLLGPTANPFNAEQTFICLRKNMPTVTDDDYLVPVGGPIFCAMAAMLAGSMNGGRIKFLQWSSRYSDYVEVVHRMF